MKKLSRHENYTRCIQRLCGVKDWPLSLTYRQAYNVLKNLMQPIVGRELAHGIVPILLWVWGSAQITRNAKVDYSIY